MLPRLLRAVGPALAVWLLVACGGQVKEPNPTPVGSLPEATAAPSPTATQTDPEEEYRLITLYPPDATRAIDEPEFYDSLRADLEYAPDELVLGVAINGEARAYPVDLLAQHEIVNDVVGGQPIAVTY
jgi:hypothetical protein